MVITIPFPLKGINKNYAESDQPNLTSPAMQNVRPFDCDENPCPGRPASGLKKQYSVCIGTGKPLSLSGP
jgi:hypothetical protein